MSKSFDAIGKMVSKGGAQTLEVLSKAAHRGGGTVPPKFCNPDNPQETWTGRGRKPKWVEECLARGMTLADLEILEET